MSMDQIHFLLSISFPKFEVLLIQIICMLSHERHLLSENEFAFSFSQSAVFMQFYVVEFHKATITPFFFWFKCPVCSDQASHQQKEQLIYS